jgi:large conductance mechanosensitive channel
LKLFDEFREFIARGNVVDLAVGVIIGGAFGKIVNSLVDQVIMPPIGLALGRVDFSELKIVLQHADPAKKTAAVAINYGSFVNTIIQFIIVAAVVFLMVKFINSIRRQEAIAPVHPPAPTPTEALLTEIRDLLAKPRVA